MRPLRMLPLGLAIGTAACSDPYPCNRYCWSHQQDVADLTDSNMMGVPDGRFDTPCERAFNLELWYPPLPSFGWYPAERCIEADLHEVIARTVTTIQDPTIDASQACDVTDLQLYGDFVQTLAQQARDACVDHLTCKGAPAGCDIDPVQPGPHACTVPSAEILCDQAIYAPALAALTDLTNGPGAAQPERDGTVVHYVDDPQDCQPILQSDTDDTPSCDGPDGGGDSGADESGTTDGSMLGPFGDVHALVTCTSPTHCTVEDELFAAVQANFEVFHDEGVRLVPVSLPGFGRGIRLSGLDRGEASEALLRALGFADGDVLTHIDGAPLSPPTIEALLLDLPTASSWRFTLRRPTGSTFAALDITLSRAS
jgi:hypothetical protein